MLAAMEHQDSGAGMRLPVPPRAPPRLLSRAALPNGPTARAPPAQFPVALPGDGAASVSAAVNSTNGTNTASVSNSTRTHKRPGAEGFAAGRLADRLLPPSLPRSLAPFLPPPRPYVPPRLLIAFLAQMAYLVGATRRHLRAGGKGPPTRWCDAHAAPRRAAPHRAASTMTTAHNRLTRC